MKKMLLGLCFALNLASFSYPVTGYTLVKQRKASEDQIMRCTTITCTFIAMLIMGGSFWLSVQAKASNPF